MSRCRGVDDHVPPPLPLYPPPRPCAADPGDRTPPQEGAAPAPAATGPGRGPLPTPATASMGKGRGHCRPKGPRGPANDIGAIPRQPREGPRPHTRSARAPPAQCPPPRPPPPHPHHRPRRGTATPPPPRPSTIEGGGLQRGFVSTSGHGAKGTGALQAPLPLRGRGVGACTG